MGDAFFLCIRFGLGSITTGNGIEFTARRFLNRADERGIDVRCGEKAPTDFIGHDVCSCTVVLAVIFAVALTNNALWMV